MQTAYYEGQLSGEKRAAYAAMYRGLTALESAVRVPLLPMPAFSDVFTVLRLDHPEIFYAEGFRIRSLPGAESGELLPEYLFDPGKIRTHRQAIAARIARLTREARKLDEAGREKYIHDFLCGNVRYDKLEKTYSHELLGPLTQGVGVCEGIAKSCKALCDALELPCVVALSAPDADAGQKYGHTWNVVRLGGAWYHLDATFDLSLGRCGATRYDYFNLNDERIFRDHRQPAFPVPACGDGGGFYYRRERLSLTRAEDVTRRVTQAIRRRQPRFVFHWRGGMLTRQALAELLGVISAAAEAAGRYAGVSVNWAQAVFCVSFLTERPTGVLELERVEEQEETE